MKYTERMVRGDVASDHIVQLFDGPETLVESVATYVTDGLFEGSTVLVVMSATHWDRVLTRLDASDISAPDALASGSLVVLDAPATLAQLMRNGAPDAERFDGRVGALVRRLAGRGTPLRVYGEMVDILAARGDFRLALELEALWNTLGEHTRFTLFCGYSAINFGDPRSLEALRLICRAHSHVRSEPGDPLATFLLDSADPEPIRSTI